MNIPRLSIHQTFAQIGIDTQKAQLSIESPRGQLEVKQEAASMDITSPKGELSVDSSAAWSALGKGDHLEWMNQIYSQLQSVALQAIGKIVEDGNRMAMITNPSNSFAEIAANQMNEQNPVEYVGEASNLNVKLNYEMKKPEINITPHQTDIQYTPQKPQISYAPGNIDIYVKQKNSIEINVSSYDWYK
ncbi:hypothetical protein SAMN04487897_11810 [Paenibacillus sp. yr247]|uniref:DUF6470 family protein n=1 Tax=Paenibacillus sp. yr247 TaxID=1761880 RepID=UPI00088DC6E1|nr:DUF6470 family protein [Paenibacillus sp. yr247]SDO61627.1 hypothetical protein SAMN04487897_11810 [Paenibacillus sp. yr247]